MKTINIFEQSSPKRFNNAYMRMTSPKLRLYLICIRISQLKFRVLWHRIRVYSAMHTLRITVTLDGNRNVSENHYIYST